MLKSNKIYVKLCLLLFLVNAIQMAFRWLADDG